MSQAYRFRNLRSAGGGNNADHQLFWGHVEVPWRGLNDNPPTGVSPSTQRQTFRSLNTPWPPLSLSPRPIAVLAARLL